jgi:Tol biopolymer transport system component
VRTGISRRLTNTLESETSPAWSPAGDSFAFISDVGGNLVVRQPAGTERRIAANVSRFEWSPSGSFLAYTRRDVLHRVSADGSATKRLSQLYATDWSWAPRDDRLAYGVVDDGDGLEIAIVDSRGGSRLVANARRVGGFVFSPTWSLDGKLLAYVREPTRARRSGDIVVYDTKRRRSRPVARVGETARNDRLGWVAAG